MLMILVGRIVLYSLFSSSVVRGVVGVGFRIIVLFVISVGLSLFVISISGKF